MNRVVCAFCDFYASISFLCISLMLPMQNVSYALQTKRLVPQNVLQIVPQYVFWCVPTFTRESALGPT